MYDFLFWHILSVTNYPLSLSFDDDNSGLFFRSFFRFMSVRLFSIWLSWDVLAEKGETDQIRQSTLQRHGQCIGILCLPVCFCAWIYMLDDPS